MLSRPVILIYVVSKTVVIFPPDHQLYLLPLFGDYPPFPSLLMTAAPPSLLMSTPPLIITPPWSTNSVPCHPISRHTVLSGRGRGRGEQCRMLLQSYSLQSIPTTRTHKQGRRQIQLFFYSRCHPSLSIVSINMQAAHM